MDAGIDAPLPFVNRRYYERCGDGMGLVQASFLSDGRCSLLLVKRTRYRKAFGLFVKMV